MFENKKKMPSSDYGCCEAHGAVVVETTQPNAKPLNLPFYEEVYGLIPCQPIKDKSVKTSFYVQETKKTCLNPYRLKEGKNAEQGRITQNNDRGRRSRFQSRSPSHRRPRSAENQRSNSINRYRSTDRSRERSRARHRSRQRSESSSDEWDRTDRHKSRSRSKARSPSRRRPRFAENKRSNLNYRYRSADRSRERSRVRHRSRQRSESSSEEWDRTDRHKSRSRSRSMSIRSKRRRSVERYRYENRRYRSSSYSQSRSKSRSNRHRRRRSSEPQGHSYSMSKKRPREYLRRSDPQYGRAESPPCRDRHRQEKNYHRVRSRTRSRSNRSRRRRSLDPESRRHRRYSSKERHAHFVGCYNRDEFPAGREGEITEKRLSPDNVNTFVAPPPPPPSESTMTGPTTCERHEEKAPEIRIHLCFYPKATTKWETATSEPGIVFVNGKRVTSISTIDLSKDGYAFQPLDITNYCHPMTNQLTIVPVHSGITDIKDYEYSVSAVKVVTGQQLCERLVKTRLFHPDHTRTLVTNQLAVEEDSEVSAIRVRASLMCPIGMTKLRYPCRSKGCRHIQCVDALTVLSLSTNKLQWPCQVCSLPTTYENLIIDGLFMEILQNVPDTVTEVEFLEDGSWIFVEMKPPVGRLDKKDISIIELDLSRTLELIDLTETDDEKTPIRKRRKLEMPMKPILEDSTSKISSGDELVNFWR